MEGGRSLILVAGLGVAALAAVGFVEGVAALRGGVADDPPAGAVLGPVLVLTAAEQNADRFVGPPIAVGDLEPDTVLRMSVTGFDSFASGRAMQCVRAPKRICGNRIGVQFGEAGAATFQYLVATDFAAAATDGQCRVRGAPCSIVVEELDGAPSTEITTVFHDALPAPGRVSVSPSTGLVNGQQVAINVKGLPPGAEVVALLCAAPDIAGEERCESLGSRATMTVQPDGTAATTLTIAAGAVGTQRVRCNRDHSCAISVVAESALVRAPVVPIGFAGPPGAGYDPGRLWLGIGGAIVLAAAAIWLIRRTDWSAIGEEAAPEIDDAEYADLDAIVASLPPEDDLEEAVGGSGRG